MSHFPRLLQPLLLLAGASFSHAAVSLTGLSSLWTPLAGNYDFLADQQTGVAAGDIVGNTQNPGFLTAFDSGTPASNTDGTLAFRVRLDDHGGNSASPQFDRVFWVGIDADLNGSVDVFVGVNRSGSNNTVGVYAPGTGANTSPSTTSIATVAFYSETLAVSNYNYRAVTALDNSGPTGHTTDITTSSSGDPDYYLSFSVPFQRIVNYLASTPLPGIALTDAKAIRYVLGTSTQGNSLNQDLGGVNGGTNSSSTWAALGGFSPTVNATGTVVPEPGTVGILLLAGAGLCLRRSRAGRKNRRGCDSISC